MSVIEGGDILTVQDFTLTRMLFSVSAKTGTALLIALRTNWEVLMM